MSGQDTVKIKKNNQQLSYSHIFVSLYRKAFPSHATMNNPGIILTLADIFFVVFHSALIIFILFGWLVPRLRTAHLICVLLTGGSWFILGLFYGIGYCPLTDWHWQVLHRMGETGLPVSYVQYILKRITGIGITASAADTLTLFGWLAALIIATYLRAADFLKRKRQQSQKPGP
ncbi:MAG: DUF2784 domain-containing protein [Bacteroidales bacterium]|nr:DUF2784 domain-containing protein [Bacteroidales bacterium]